MPVRIITADERMARPRHVKGAIFGPSGVGKTSLIRTLTSTRALLIDLEAGDLAVADTNVDSVQIRRWEDMVDLACLIGGPNLSLPDSEPFSAAHFAYVESQMGPRDEVLAGYDLIFVDSITVLSRLAMAAAERHPDNITKTGAKDTRGAYGMMGRSVIALLTHMQHCPDKSVVFVGILDAKANDFGQLVYEPQMEGSKIGRELPGIVDEVFTMVVEPGEGGVPRRVLYTSQANERGYPAKDRSGKLAPIEPADLQHVLDKINGRAA